MKFKAPETLDGLTVVELDELRTAALEESNELAAVADAELTDEQLTDLEGLGEALAAISAAKSAVLEAEQARTERLAAARGKLAEASAEDEVSEPQDGGEEAEPEPAQEEVEVPDDASELAEVEEKELVTASAAARPAGVKRSVAAAAGRKVEEPDVPAAKPTVMVAAANLPGIDLRQSFTSMNQLASTWQQKESKSPTAGRRSDINDIRRVQGLSDKHVRQSFARIVKPELEFSAGLDMSVAEQLEQIDAAANERKRFGRGGLAKAALTAAGGWCAPSETVYDFCSFETVSGILDLPTVQIRRGGINFTKGPSYADLAADWGFEQTEAQAEAGTVKDCYAVECPPFEDHRMDVVGFCITAGVLTASPAGYPELIQRVLEIGTVAHAHKVNADNIQRISDLIGTAVDYAEIGATTNDVLDAVGIAAASIRYQLAMDPNATVEGVAPLWLQDIIRADLGRRNGVDMLSVSNADIDRYLAARQVRLQFVYDYQNLAGTGTGGANNTAGWTKYPGTVEIMLWPAGAFVRGTSNVIDMDTIYDSVGLSTNTYTAAFFEEGQMIFNRCGFGVKYTIDVSCLAGRTGAADVTCTTPAP